MEEQRLDHTSQDYRELDDYFRKNQCQRILLVAGKSLSLLNLGSYFESLEQRPGIRVVWFDNFKPNPGYPSVVDGVACYQREGCDQIVAVGGGSAMDVAKCIKLFSNMDSSQSYLEQEIVPNEIHFMAIPTTAGTGSEATRFAVIYKDGIKQSVTHDSCIPEAVFFDASALKTLPDYHRKATMMDALCHGIESYWSIRSTKESREYSQKAIREILEEKDSYLDNTDSGNAGMLRAANHAGRAINLAQTTAGHAMSYKLTGLYGIAHGHAAALCVSELFSDMVQNPDRCVDERGREHLEKILLEIAGAFGCDRPEEAVKKWNQILKELSLEIPVASKKDYEILKKSVNPERLKNHPVSLNEERIDRLYHRILDQKKTKHIEIERGEE